MRQSRAEPSLQDAGEDFSRQHLPDGRHVDDETEAETDEVQPRGPWPALCRPAPPLLIPLLILIPSPSAPLLFPVAAPLWLCERK
jgi:hypothetical protein